MVPPVADRSCQPPAEISHHSGIHPLDVHTRAARLDTLRNLIVQSIGGTSQGPPQNQPEDVPSEIWAYNSNPGPQDEFLAPAPTPTPDSGIDSSNWACPICQGEVVAGEVRE